MSEDTTALEKCTPVRIRLNGKKVTVAVPEHTSINDLLDATGAKLVRAVTQMHRFYEKAGVQVSEPDHIIGPWQNRNDDYHRRKRFLSSSGWYELHAPDKDKLNEFLEKYLVRN